MLQNARVTAFTVSELLRENKQGGVAAPPRHTHTHRLRFRVKKLALQGSVENVLTQFTDSFEKTKCF